MATELLDDSGHRVRRTKDMLLGIYAFAIFFSQLMGEISIGGLFGIAGTGGFLSYLQLLLTTAFALTPVLISFFLETRIFRILTLAFGLANFGLLLYTYYELFQAGLFSKTGF